MRAELALISVTVDLTSAPAPRATIAASCDVRSTDDVVVASVSLETDASIGQVTIELGRTTRAPRAIGVPASTQETDRSLVVDAGRAVAFAAATRDLNPLYWNHGAAIAAGLPGTVSPPGLVAAWVLTEIERLAGPLQSAELIWANALYPPARVAAAIDGNSGARYECLVRSGSDVVLHALTAVRRPSPGNLFGREAS
jgi:hypothetical protein